MATSTRDLLTGLASTIAGSGIGTYRADGTPYAAGETAITFYDSPPSPDRVVMMVCVPLTDATVIPLGQWLVQFYFRGLPGNPLDVDDLGDAVFDLLHGARDLTLGSTHVIQCLRQNSIGNGQDPARRWTRIDRYILDLDVAATVNRPAGGWD